MGTGCRRGRGGDLQAGPSASQNILPNAVCMREWRCPSGRGLPPGSALPIRDMSDMPDMSDMSDMSDTSDMSDMSDMSDNV